MKTVAAVYKDFSTGGKVVKELVQYGVDRQNINLVARNVEQERKEQAVATTTESEGVTAGEGATIGAIEGGVLGLLAGFGALLIPGIGPVLAAGPILGALTGAGVGAITGGVTAGLIDSGIPEEDASYYNQAVSQGGALVTVRTADSKANYVARIMSSYAPSDIETRRSQVLSQGVANVATGTTASAGLSTKQTIEQEGEVRLPIVQEELKVTKQAVERGGVRIHTYIERVPVQEDVQLRQEHVTVERRAVDRPVRDADLTNFSEETIEVKEMAEEVVTAKEARIVEEVVVSKDVLERTEHISDTVRRTDVQVEEHLPTTGVSTESFTTYGNDFRTHYNTLDPEGAYTYDHYEPAYRYGYAAANAEQYRGRTWADIEPDVQRRWEKRNPGTWQQFKNSVRHAWNKATS